MWYIIVSLTVMIWTLFNAWVFMPWFTLRKLRKELATSRFQQEIMGYFVKFLLQPRQFKDEEGNVHETNFFADLLNEAFTYMWARGEEKLKNFKSQTAKNIDSMLADTPIGMIDAKIMPKRYRGLLSQGFKWYLDHMQSKKDSKSKSAPEVGVYRT